MNPFIYPFTAPLFIKNFLIDPGRLNRLGQKQMKRYRDRAFRNIVRYAWRVPLYYKKWKKAGIYPHDIKRIEDIKKLPFITKKDIIDSFPEDSVPSYYNRDRGRVICTSGSSGKPLLHIYVDFSIFGCSTANFLRTLNRFNLHWRNARIAHVGNFTFNHADLAFENGFVDKARMFHSFDNYLTLNGFDPIQDVVKRLNEFKPDVIISYPATYRHLAYFKRKGKAPDINPKAVLVGASITDEYTRNYVEEAFGCQMLNSYSSTESSAEIAFECKERIWHINHDWFHVEAVDDDMNLVSYGEKGRIALTRMFGWGTPIIRYAGMDDWITIDESYSCSCGFLTPILKEGVEGRVSANIFLPNGRFFSSASFASMSHFALNDLNTRKVIQFQIVQKKIDEIDFLMVFDKDLKNKAPSKEKIFKKIEEAYRDKVGSDVQLNFKEVDEIKSEPGKPPLLVVSKVKPEEGYKIVT
jgi:phenylacetate-CoA ligase